MDQVVVKVVHSIDIAKARRAARAVAELVGMDKYDSMQIETSTSELATNLIRHAGGGSIALEKLEEEGRTGIRITSRDEGPGIADVDVAIKGGYSTGGSMGAGLSGVKRMMDEFEISSEPGRGTTVVAVKWLKQL